MLHITDEVTIADWELSESFIRSSGPGGQNVNKVSTAVELRFDVARSPSLPEPVRERLMRLAGRRLTQDGVLVLFARAHRSQVRNREAALEALLDLIRRAAVPPVPRRATRPTLASKKRRLEAKTRRGAVKRGRTSPPDD